MRDLKVPLLSLATLSALLLGSQATAQIMEPADFQPRNDAGVFSIKRSFNATQLTDFPGIDCNGEEKACALVSAIFHKGRFFVLGREGWCCGSTPAVSALTPMYKWTSDGIYEETQFVPIPGDPEDETGPYEGTNAESGPGDAPESRDMATDEWRLDPVDGFVASGGQAVFIGTEEGIYVTRYNAALDEWELWDEYESANGTKTVANGDFTNPIRGAGLATLRVYGTPEDPRKLGGTEHFTTNGEGEGYMGVAYDRDGNGGDGSFWVSADDGSGVDGLVDIDDPRGDEAPDYDETYGDCSENTKPILEIDGHGNILRTLNNGPIDDDPESETFGLPLGGYWCAGGLEIDPFTKNLWVGVDMSQNTIEVDITTGLPTGISFAPFRVEPDRQGGLVAMPKGDPGSYASYWDMINFTNVAGDDFFTTHRMHLYSGLHGLQEAYLQASTGSLDVGVAPPIAYVSDDTLNLYINTEGRGTFEGSFGPATVAFMFIDLNEDVSSDAETDFTAVVGAPILPEMRIHSVISNPLATVPAPLPFVMATNTLLEIPLVGFPINTGDQIRFQGVVLDPRSNFAFPLGLIATNEIWYSGVGINEVLIEAEGSNADDLDPDGFWKVHWLEGPAITAVTLSFDDTTTSASFFDSDFEFFNDNRNDTFEAGRGYDPVTMTFLDLGGCDGTYRHDSDLLTGLIYDDLNTPDADMGNNPACQYYRRAIEDGGLGYTTNTGAIGIHPYSTGGFYYGGITFRFDDFGKDGSGGVAAGPEVFAWDIGIFNAPDNSGGSLVGLAITVKREGMPDLTAELLPDPETDNRVFIGW